MPRHKHHNFFFGNSANNSYNPAQSSDVGSTAKAAGIAAGGLMIVAVGLLIGIVVLIGHFTHAAVVPAIVVTNLTTVSATSTGAIGLWAVGFSATTFGLGALSLYATIGLLYMYSAAKETYSSDINTIEMLKSRIINEDGLTVKGIFKSIGAILWTPFLLVGGLAGQGIKLIAMSCSNKNTKGMIYPQQEIIETSSSSSSSIISSSLITTSTLDNTIFSEQEQEQIHSENEIELTSVPEVITHEAFIPPVMVETATITRPESTEADLDYSDMDGPGCPIS